MSISAHLEETITLREKGAVPCSIATSLALEGLIGFGEYEDRESQLHLFNELWVNVRTLHRNCYNAIGHGNHFHLAGKDLIEPIVEDSAILKSTIDHYSQGRLKIIFYYCSLKSVPKIFSKAALRQPKTPKQQLDADVEQAVMTILTNKRAFTEFPILQYDTFIEDKGGKGLLLTHYATDLLSRKSFTHLHLLESHTGMVKDRSLWYTKLTGGKQLNRIPFNKMTLQIFGDNNVLFYAMPVKIKKQVLEIAEMNRWTPLTTDMKIKTSISKLSDPKERMFYYSLL